mgnify:CR=1 FL=1
MVIKKMFELPKLNDCNIAIIGLGYVGLPLALEYAKCKKSFIDKKTLKRNIIGFDINTKRILQLRNGDDLTKETDLKIIDNLDNLEFTNDPDKLIDVDVFIITVPTPIDIYKKPDLNFLKMACQTIGTAMKKSISEFSPVVIFESTVYPGATEEFCVPIIESFSGLNIYTNSGIEKSFGYGYSPERINPGDKKHMIGSVVKVTSGNNEEVANWIDQLYGSVIKSGTYKAQSVKVAEAAKIIENTQRDLNIALINELSIILRKLKIDTLDVLNAAKTKWNFIPFYPGLVGGHCIGVDPYYLTFKSEQVGYSPELILAGRKINDEIPSWHIEQLILEMVRTGKKIATSNALILGFTFKENCTDIRNTKVIDMVNTLKKYNVNIELVDPYANKEETFNHYGLKIKNKIENIKQYEIIIVTVAHQYFLNFNFDFWKSLCKDEVIILDLKGIVPKNLNPIRP